MRKPRDEGRSTRSSGTRTRVTAAPKKNTVPKVKPKAKAKPLPKKQGKDVDRPMQVTVIRVRNPKTSKNIIPGGVSKQKSQQKRKTAAVVGALKEDLLKKLAVKVDDKFVNTLFEVSVVSKKVLARKKKKDEEPMQSSQEKPLKREASPVKQQVRAKKESLADTKLDVNPLKESEKRSSKDSEKKSVSKETKKNSTKDDKKSNKEDKKPEKKIISKACDKKVLKKTEKKNTVKDTLKQTPKEIKKNTRGSKLIQSGSKKIVQTKTKNKGIEETLKTVKTEKPDKVSEVSERDLEGGKKENDGSKKDNDCSKKESTENSRRDREIEEFVKSIKKEPEETKKLNENTKKEVTSKKEKDNDGHKKNTDVCKKEVDENKNNSEQSTKPEGAKKSKSTKDDDPKKQKIVKEEDSKKSKSTKEDELKSSKNGKDEEIKNTKIIKTDEPKTAKKIPIKATAESKRAVESKNSTKKINEKEKSKNSAKKEPKKAASRPSSKSREVVKEEKKPTKKCVKRKPKIECELEGSAKISQILNTPKRHREASLNALAKVHCLYENESRGVIMDIIDKSEKLYQEEKKLQEEKKREEKKRVEKKQEDEKKLQEEKKVQEERILQEEKKLREEKKIEADKKNGEEKKKEEDKKNQESITKKSEAVTIKREQVSADEDEIDEAPARNLRTAPGIRSVGRHWDIFNALSSSSSEDSTDSSSERKPIEEPPKSPPKAPEKKVRRRRKRTEVIMDLKDMVVKKRMASLNASAMMAATYSMDKRSSRSDDDSLRKDSDSRESLSSPEVVEVVETSEDEVILSGRKKALVIVNQDNSDLTITGVYVNSTTRTRHEGFCSFAGMQYRISSTSHTQTETAVSTETTVHTVTTEQHQQQQAETTSRTAPAPGNDGGGCAKTYTPLGALSNMQPPGSPRYPPSPASSAFSAPPHHHPPAPPPPPPPHPHQEIHDNFHSVFNAALHLHSTAYQNIVQSSDPGYFQPAGPLISTTQLKAGPSQEEMQGTSSQAVTYTTYPPHPSGYLEPPGYPPHAYPKYPPPPPPPPGYPHRRYFYPNIEPTYPPHYPHPSYYSPYTPPPQPPPHFRPGSYMDNPFHPCPCPMPQTCPKNVHTGPLTGTSKGSESNSTVPPVGASRGPVQLNPVALALPPEPNTAVNPPSPARGSAGLPPPASPALAQASWGTPPPPQSPGLLTAVEPQPRRKRRRTTSISPPPPDHSEKLSEEPPDKLLRPIDRKVQASEKYDHLQNPVDRYKPDKTLLCDRLQPPSETVIQTSHRSIDLSETLIQSKTIHNADPLNQSNFIDKKCDRLTHALDKIQQSAERAVQSEKNTAKCKATVQCEKASDRSVQPSEKSVHAQTGRPPHPSDVISHSNDRSVHASDKIIPALNRLNHVNDKDPTVSRSKGHDRFSERIMPPIDRISQSDRPVQLSVRVTHTSEPLQHERNLISAERTLHERLPLPDRTKSVPQERMSRPTERLVPSVSDLQNGHLPSEAEIPYKDTSEITIDEPCRKRSLSRESTDVTPKRRISVNKRAPRPKKLSSPAEADIAPAKRDSKSPENIKVKKACVPPKNGRRKKEEIEINICQEIVEIASLANSPQLKWSNGWSWRGEPFTATVYIRDDRTEVRKCYPAMEHREGDIIHPRDCILLKSAGSRKNLPFVAKVAALWENPDDGEMMVSLLWYYRPEHTEQGRQPHQPPDEVFASRHKDSNSVACIEDKCYVLTFNEYCRYMKRCRQMDSNIRGWTPVPGFDGGYPRANRMPPGRVSRDLIFFCRKVYDFRLSRILKNPC